MVNQNIQGPIPLSGVGFSPKRYGNYQPGEFKRLSNVVLKDGVISTRRNVYSVHGEGVGAPGIGVTNHQKFYGVLEQFSLTGNGTLQYAVGAGSMQQLWSATSAPGRPVTAGSFTKFVGFFRYNNRNYWLAVEYTAGVSLSLTLYHGVLANPDIPSAYDAAYAATLTRSVILTFNSGTTDYRKFRFNNFMLYKDRLWISTSIGVFFSKATDPAVFAVPDGGFFKYPDTNIKWVMSVYDAIYVLCDNSIHAITYSTDPNVDSTSRPISDIVGGEMGCIHQDTPYVINNTGIYELTNSGVSRILDNVFDVGEDFYSNHIYSFENYLVVNKYSKINSTGAPSVPGIIRTNFFPNGVSDTGGANTQIRNGWTTTEDAALTVNAFNNAIYPGYAGQVLEADVNEDTIDLINNCSALTGWTDQSTDPIDMTIQLIGGDNALRIRGLVRSPTYNVSAIRNENPGLSASQPYLLFDVRTADFVPVGNGSKAKFVLYTASVIGGAQTRWEPVHIIAGGGWGGSDRYYFQPTGTIAQIRPYLDTTEMGTQSPTFTGTLTIHNIDKVGYLPTAAPAKFRFHKNVPFAGFIAGARHDFRFKARCGDSGTKSLINLRVKIESRDAGNVVLSTAIEDFSGLNSVDWTDIVAKFTPPTSTTNLQITLEGSVKIETTGGVLNSQGLYQSSTLTCHEFLIEYEATYAGYFNGNNTDTTNVTYAWTGVAWESTSTADAGSSSFQFDEIPVFSPGSEGNTFGYNTFFIDTQSGTVQTLEFYDQYDSDPDPGDLGYTVDFFVNPRIDSSGNYNMYFATSKLISQGAGGFEYRTYYYRMNSSPEDLQVGDYVIDRVGNLKLKAPLIDIEIDSFVPDGLEYMMKKFRSLEIMGIFPQDDFTIYSGYDNEEMSLLSSLGFNDDFTLNDGKRPHFAHRIGLNQRGHSLSLRFKNENWPVDRSDFYSSLELSDLRVLWSYTGRAPTSKTISS